MARRRPGKPGGRPARAKGRPVAAPAGRSAGYALVLVYLAGSLCTGVMGLAFVFLAIWLAYSEIAAAGEIRLKLLMMPMMNILISSILFYYFHSLRLRARQLRCQVETNTYVPAPVRATRYDLLAILGFLLTVGLISYFMISR